MLVLNKCRRPEGTGSDKVFAPRRGSENSEQRVYLKLYPDPKEP